jgi:hypothetical protein
VILKLSSVVRTADASLNFGCATLTMTAVTTRTNLLTCAANVTARLDGNAAQDNRTIVASRNGSSAMAKTIVATTVMNSQKIVPFAKPKLISNARTTAAFRNNGRVTLQMIVVMAQMSQKHNVKENTAIALNPSSVATMENVFRADGDAVSLVMN